MLWDEQIRYEAIIEKRLTIATNNLLGPHLTNISRSLFFFFFLHRCTVFPHVNESLSLRYKNTDTIDLAIFQRLDLPEYPTI